MTVKNFNIEEQFLSDNAKKFTLEALQEVYDFLESSAELRDEKMFYSIINVFPESKLESICDAVHFYTYFNRVIDPRAIPLKALLALFVLEGTTFGPKYQSFCDWLRNSSKISELCNKDADAIQKAVFSLNEAHLNHSGVKRNFKALFTDHLTPAEQKELLQAFSVIDDKGSEQPLCNDLDGFASFLVDIRNKFAHKAQLNHFTARIAFPHLGQDSAELISSYKNNKGEEILLHIRLDYDDFDALCKKIIFRCLSKTCSNERNVNI